MMPLSLAVLALAFIPHPPDATVPEHGRVLSMVEGRGVQIYRCAAEGGNFGWSFDAPEAKLIDQSTQAQVGTHGAGPVWAWKDGSAVKGTVVQKIDSPEAGSVPWLLLSAQAMGEKAGALSEVIWVRRSETHGGIAPVEGCDAAHVGAVARVAYRARYTFYTAE